MLSKKERKAIERIEDFLTTNIIISILSDETSNSEEFKAFISKNEYLAIEFIATMFLKHSQEIEDNKKYIDLHYVPYEQYTSKLNELNKKWKDKIKAKIEYLLKRYDTEEDFCSYDVLISILKSLLEKE